MAELRICARCGNKTDQFHKGKTICKDCNKRESIAWYHANKERGRATREIWKANNREKHLAMMKQWRDTHPEQFKTKKQEAYQRKRVEYDALKTAWFEAHPDETKEIRRRAHEKWCQLHPAEVLEKAARRRARKRAATTEDVSYDAILNRDGFFCYLCQKPVDDPEDIHFDHIIPLCKGGTHSMDNIAVTHSLCNWKKGTRILPTSF